MPPKKKPEKKKEPEEEPVGYNIDAMTLDQLKQYALLLQSEIEDMRKHCNFYQKMEDELVELLRVARDDLRQNEMEILYKDVELERLKLKFIKHLEEKRQWPEYMEHSSSVRKENISSEADSRLEEEYDRHVKEKKRLETVLQEKHRRLEALRRKIEMTRRETIETNDSHLKQFYDRQKGLLEQAVNKFGVFQNEIEADFEQAKDVILFEAREDKIRGQKTFKEASEALKANLQNYYRDLTKKDLDIIKLLKQKIKTVEENISISKHLLQESHKENKCLTEVAHPKFRKRPNQSVEKFDAGPLKMIEALKMHNRTEKLCVENQKLEEQIKHVMEQTYELRRHFTLTLKKVRDTAETKPVILKNKLNFVINERSADSECSETERKNEAEESSEKTEI